MTAVALSHGGDPTTDLKLSESHVRFARLSKADIAAYLNTDEWQGKAGGYAIQGHAARFIAWMQGSYTGIVGLPVHETANLLIGHGYAISSDLSSEG